MESRWRWNVAYWGYSQSDWRLAARLLSGTTPTPYLLVRRTGDAFVWRYLATTTSLPMWDTFFPSFGPGFEGYNVEAD